MSAESVPALYEDPIMTDLNDPALAAWLDEHRRHALALIHHMLYYLEELDGHHARNLDAAIADRVALSKAASEIAVHLESVELHRTPLWQRYLMLASNPTAETAHWRELYRSGGGKAVREYAVYRLETVARDLEHPPAEMGLSGADHAMADHLTYYINVAVVALQPTRDALAHLGHHPRDEVARETATHAWSALVEASHDLANRCPDGQNDPVADANMFEPRHPHHSHLTLVRNDVVKVLAELADPAVEAAARLDGHDTAASVHLLETALHRVTGYLNHIDAMLTS
jgi:hypothetical protein